jgi:hypothetical protein
VPINDPTAFKAIRPTITNVTVPSTGRPVIDFRLTNELGQPLTGLVPGNVRFVMARLVAPANGKSSEWQAYTRRTENPTPGVGTGTQPVNQATTETATAGTFVDHGNGTYT